MASRVVYRFSLQSNRQRANLIAMTQSRMSHHGVCVVFETRCVGKTTAEELRKEHHSGYACLLITIIIMYFVELGEKKKPRFTWSVTAGYKYKVGKYLNGREVSFPAHTFYSSIGHKLYLYF